MNKKLLILLAFLVIVLLQLYVPANMIWEQEEVIKSGTEFKFKTSPIDPSDPFRGKYVWLNYPQEDISVENEKDWKWGQQVYAEAITGEDGFAKIKAIFKEKPTSNKNYFRAKINYVSSGGNNNVRLRYPFDRFYMDEYKAEKAEDVYRYSQRDTSKTTYALVNILNG